MILVPLTVSRVTKSRLTLWVCTTVTTTGHLRELGIPTTPLLSEEDSRSSREHAKVAMELCIRSMICLWTRVLLKSSLWRRWSTYQRSIQAIRNTEATSFRSGTSDKELFTIECGHHTWPPIRQRTPTSVFGHPIYPRLLLITLVWSTIHTICWLDTTTILHSVSTSQRVDISTHTTITWLLLCLLSFMMVWSSMKMALQLLPHRWLMTCLSTSCSSLAPRFQIRRSWFTPLCSSPSLSTQSLISSRSIIISIATRIDLRSTPSRTEAIRNLERRPSELTRLQVTGSVSTRELMNYHGIHVKETTISSPNFIYLNLHWNSMFLICKFHF